MPTDINTFQSGERVSRATLATTTNIVLEGLQTIQSIPLQSLDYVLVNAQTDPKENGLYIVLSNRWERVSNYRKPKDFVEGKLIYIIKGSFAGSFFTYVGVSNPVLGEDNIVFSYAGNITQAQLDAELSSLNASIATNTSNIATLTTSTNTNTSNIATLTTSTNTNTSDITMLKDAGWVVRNLTWTRISDHQFSIPSFVTGLYPKGTRVRFSDGTVKYGVVANSAWSSPNTIVTLVPASGHKLVGGTITINSTSYLDSVVDFPSSFEMVSTGFVANTARFTVHGKRLHITGVVRAQSTGVASASTSFNYGFTFGTPPDIQCNYSFDDPSGSSGSGDTTFLAFTHCDNRGTSSARFRIIERSGNLPNPWYFFGNILISGDL